MNEWIDQFNEAIAHWVARGSLVNELYSLKHEGEVMALVTLEKRYQDSIILLSEEAQQNTDYLASKLASEHEPTIKVAIHIILESGNKALCTSLIGNINRQINNLHFHVAEILRVCKPDIVAAFCPTVLSEKALWVLEAFADVVGNNQLSGCAQYYVTDNKLLSHSSRVLKMLGKLGEHKALVEAVAAEESNYHVIESCARSLLLMGSDHANKLYRRLISEEAEDGSVAWPLGLYAIPGDIEFLKSTALNASDHYLPGILRAIGYAGDFTSTELLQTYLDRSVEIRAAACDAISSITGEYGEVDPESSAEELIAFWEGWLREAESDFNTGVRYENGDPFDAFVKAEDMLEGDFESRKANYEALIVYTGIRLPFDETRYLIDQINQRNSILDALEAKDSDLPGGKWLRFGQAYE